MEATRCDPLRQIIVIHDYLHVYTSTVLLLATACCVSPLSYRYQSTLSVTQHSRNRHCLSFTGDVIVRPVVGAPVSRVRLLCSLTPTTTTWPAALREKADAISIVQRMATTSAETVAVGRQHYLCAEGFW